MQPTTSDSRLEFNEKYYEDKIPQPRRASKSKPVIYLILKKEIPFHELTSLVGLIHGKGSFLKKEYVYIWLDPTNLVNS